MPSYRPSFFGRRSKSSPTRIREMPVISEDDAASKASYEASTPGVHMPRAPLRVPPKSYRRSLQQGTNNSLPPYVPSSNLRHQQEQQQRQAQQHQQYAPQYRFEEKVYEDVGDRGEERGLRRFIPFRSRDGHGGGMGGFGERRRWRRFMLLVAVVIAVIVALAVGLSVGLRDNSKHNKSKDESDPDTSYPAGSYAFNTILEETQAGCTSSAATWRCYPYSVGESATFYWIINPDSSSTSSSSNYTISSTDNPFAPSFTNLSTTLLDRDQPTERLVFSFPMNKTVVPSDALTPNNRAATCTFPDTSFEATLWTRRSGNATIGDGGGLPGGGSSRFGDWPADIEVRQVMNSTIGEPRCQDSMGNFIADVQAGGGACECRYTSS